MRYSESAERALIAAVLSGSDLSAELLRDVQAGDFVPERNKVIWSTAQEALAAGVKPDIIQVRDRLEMAGKLPSVDGAAYLMEICDEHISDSGLEGASKIVRDHSIARSAAVAARKIGAMVEDGEESGEIVSRLLAAAAELSAAAEGRRRKPENVFGVLDGILNNNEPEQLKTGFGFIDNYTRISAQNFIVIGARPGAGKSSLALGIAISASWQASALQLPGNVDHGDDGISDLARNANRPQPDHHAKTFRGGARAMQGCGDGRGKHHVQPTKDDAGIACEMP